MNDRKREISKGQDGNMIKVFKIRITRNIYFQNENQFLLTTLTSSREAQPLIAS